MLQQIWRLRHEHQWSEILNQAPALLPHYEGEQLAWLHSVIADALEATATDRQGYREALYHVSETLALTPVNSFLHVWTLHRAAAYSADLGFFADAENAATAFLAALPSHPKAQSVAAYAWFALARCRHYQHRYQEALALFDSAMASGATGALAERIQLFRAWTLGESGAVATAFCTLPEVLNHAPAGLGYAVQALLFAQIGEWSNAERAARFALRDHDAWHVCDSIQTVELYLILKTAAIKLGRYSEATVWAYKAAALSRWNVGLMSRLVPMLRAEGGDSFHAATLRRAAHGSAGYDGCALTSTVG